MVRRARRSRRNMLDSGPARGSKGAHPCQIYAYDFASIPEINRGMRPTWMVKYATMINQLKLTLQQLPNKSLGGGLLFSSLVFTCLAVIVISMNGSALNGNWRWDDPSILHHLHKYSFISDFTQPEVWRQFSPANLTPWLIVSFDIDLLLFGMRPQLFYLHQLLAITAVSFALYLCLTLWVRKRVAFLGAALLLCSTPVLLAAQQLMTRHYVEGAVFCLLSLILFVNHLRSGGSLMLLASACFYMLAIFAKEVYVPLVILLPFLPEATFIKRIRALLPFFAIVVSYVVWRSYMLNTLAGGYSGGSDLFNIAFLSDVIMTFLRFPTLLFGQLQGFATLMILLLVTAYAWFCRKHLWLGITVLTLSLLPLIPLVQFPGILIADRYLFLVVIVCSFIVAFCAGRLLDRANAERRYGFSGIIYGIMLFLCISLFLQGNKVRSSVLEVAGEFDVQSDFIWTNNSNLAFIPSAHILPNYWFVANLIAFKASLLPDTTAPAPVPDAIYLEGVNADLYEYDARCSCMQEVSVSVTEMLEANHQLRRDDAALSLQYSYDAGYFIWEFGPYDNGEYHVVSQVIGVIPAPRAGRLRVTLAEDTPFYLRYTAPEGWITYSDEQRIRSNQSKVYWQREAL